MTAKRTFSTFILSTFFFTLIFYQKSIGINLLLFEAGLLGTLWWMKEYDLKQKNVRFVFSAVVVSAVFTVIHRTNLSIQVNLLCFFLFIGAITEPNLKSLLNAFLTAISSVFQVFPRLKSRLSTSRVNQKKLGFNLRRNLRLIIPVLIICGFAIIYGIANPKFGELVTSFIDFIGNGFTHFFEVINIQLIGIILLGAVISLFVLIRTRNERISEKDGSASDVLSRVRRKVSVHFSPIGLTNEYRAAVFLFLSLNGMLLVLNALDVNYVWFNFKWEGQYLKDFVHNGVYVLIFALLVSILLVLYFFRNNLNFYRKGKWLKRLSYVWLAQNAVLVISVGIRNWYYIDYYALADRRIAIFFFLVLVAFALVTVYLKVKQTRSKFYFIRRNVQALVVVLVIGTFFNWDRVIARYNFKHANRSFIHLNYLVGLSDASLPYLDQPLEKLIGANNYQKKSFFKIDLSSSSYSSYDRLYMTPEDYIASIEKRKKAFIRSWEEKSWLEWNLAEALAYHELKSP